MTDKPLGRATEVDTQGDSSLQCVSNRMQSVTSGGVAGFFFASFLVG